jgi:hypothetical protein
MPSQDTTRRRHIPIIRFNFLTKNRPFHATTLYFGPALTYNFKLQGCWHARKTDTIGAHSGAH